MPFIFFRLEMKFKQPLNIAYLKDVSQHMGDFQRGQADF